MTLPERARALYGAVLVVYPPALLGRHARHDHDAVFALVVRVLGARHVAQACITTARPTRTVLRLGAAADVLHALTDVACAAVDRRRSRAALSDAAVALAFAAASVQAARARSVRDR